MKTKPNHAKTPSSGFTLPELMVAVLISILVIGALYQVFSRVQEMFRIGHNQSLVLERGRAIMDMIVRDLEMMRASGLVFTENLNARDFGVEFLVNSPDFISTLVPGNIVFNQRDRKYYILDGHPQNPDHWKEVPADNYTTKLPGKDLFSGDFSFFGHDRKWHLFGYGLYSFLGARVPNTLVGSLYRYQDSDESRPLTMRIERYKSRLGLSGFSKIADGVVHLRIRAVSPMDPARAPMEETFFKGVELPLYVEVELGILEDTVVGELEALAENYDPDKLKNDQDVFDQYFDAQVALIRDNLDKLHLFRQLIPIRNSRFLEHHDPAKYTIGADVFRRNGFDTSQGDFHVFLVDRAYSTRFEHCLEDIQVALKTTLKNLEDSGQDKYYYIVFYSDERNFGQLGIPDEERWYSATKKTDFLSETRRISSTVSEGESSDPTMALNWAFRPISPVINEPGKCVDTLWLVSNGPFNAPPDDLLDLIETCQNKLAGMGRKQARINTVGFARRDGDLDEGDDAARSTLKRIVDELSAPDAPGEYLLITPDESIRRN